MRNNICLPALVIVGMILGTAAAVAQSVGAAPRDAAGRKIWARG
jgi:hypothetical protein